MTHDPSEYIRGLQQLLVSDKKKIAFLFGAGTSLSKKNDKSLVVPAIGKMTEIIESKIIVNDIYKKAIDEIKIEIKNKKLNYNIETLLSNLEQKIEIIGIGKLNGLNIENITALIKEIKTEVRTLVSIHKKILEDNKTENLIHSDFAEWIGRAVRKYPIEIFTTNYDYLFELGLESKNIPYYDGFTGSYQPFFNSESVDDMSFLPRQTKLWKIHGSLGWHFDKISKNVWRKDSDSEDMLIYPSITKYNNSKKQPYTALMDRLNNFLKEPDTILITCGYSFGDDHINERILTALQTNTTAHVIALLYDTIWENKIKSYSLKEGSALMTLAKSNGKLSIYGRRNAVIGCQNGIWKLKREADKEDTINLNNYFDEDAPVNDNIKVGDKARKVLDKWTGEGEMTISDFTKFVMFLKSMIIQNGLNNDK